MRARGNSDSERSAYPAHSEGFILTIARVAEAVGLGSGGPRFCLFFVCFLLALL
jgi:hypothetical protein